MKRRAFLSGLAVLAAPFAGDAQQPAARPIVRLASVKDFNAKGDGVTDDTAAIQAAIDSVTTNAGIKFPAGTYVIGAAGLSISNKTNVVFQGDGAKLKINAVATQSPAGLNSTAICLNTCTHTTFTGFEIDGNGKASNVIGAKGCTDCEISHNKISSGGLMGQIVGLINTRNRYLFNKLANGTGSSRGMWLGNYSASQMENDLLVMGNQVDSEPATGIVCASIGGRVEENQVFGCSGSGIIFGGANGYSSKHLSIANNVCLSNKFHGIQSDVSYSTTADLPVGIAISGNVCELNYGSGIYAIYMTGGTISGNVCNNNNSDAIGSGHGIQLDEASDLTITKNTCGDTRAGGSRTQTNGIAIVAGIGKNNIKNITVSRNICNNNSHDGIDVVAVSTQTIDGVSVTGNQCNSNGSRGIMVAEGTADKITRITVIGNLCDGNTTTDLRVDVLDAAISDNRYTTESGIKYFTIANNSTTPSVKGNRISFRAINTAPTTITNFTNGVNGQTITIFAGNSNTTIMHGATIRLNGNVNFAMVANDQVTLHCVGTVWIEVTRGTAN